MKKEIKPIFIIGTQRSGSNLLRLMLNQLDEIAAPHPPHILASFFPLLNYYGNLEVKENFSRLVQDVCRFVNMNIIPWDLTLNPEKIRDKCRTFSLIEILTTVYEEYAEHHQALFWCCKSMDNVNYVPEIEAAGLKPVYIHLFRDGRDVALSFKKVVVGEKHIYHLAQQWSQDQEKALDYCSRLAPERTIKVRYEDLIHQAVQEVNRICGFLQIPFNEKVLDFYKPIEANVMAKTSPMFSNLNHPVNTHNDKKYLNQATHDDLSIFETVAGDTLAKLGYDLKIAKEKRLKLTADDIQRFDLENERLKKEVWQHADNSDAAKRLDQKIFLDQIKTRSLNNKVYFDEKDEKK